jgi:hypothetical protein
MAIQMTEHDMAKTKGRPKKPSGEGTPVRIDSDIVARARYLAAQKDIPVSELLSDFLRPIIDREFKKAGKDLLGEGGGK